MNRTSLIAAAAALIVSGACVATVSAQQAPATPAAPAKPATPLTPPAIGDQVPAFPGGDVASTERSRKLALTLQKLIEQSQATQAQLNDLRAKVTANVRNYDAAEQYIKAEIDGLKSLVDGLNPDGDIVKAIEDIEKRWRLLIAKHEHSQLPELRKMSETFKDKLKKTTEYREKIKRIRQQLHEQLNKVNDKMDVFVAARQAEVLDQMMSDVEKTLGQYEDTVKVTAELTDIVRDLNSNVPVR